MIPVYEAALKGLKRENPGEYEKLLGKIQAEPDNAHDYAISVARDTLESKKN